MIFRILCLLFMLVGAAYGFVCDQNLCGSYSDSGDQGQAVYGQQGGFGQGGQGDFGQAGQSGIGKFGYGHR